MIVTFEDVRVGDFLCVTNFIQGLTLEFWAVREVIVGNLQDPDRSNWTYQFNVDDHCYFIGSAKKRVEIKRHNIT